MGASRWLLHGYLNNLIERQQIYGRWTDGRLISNGEWKAYDSYQTEYADVGMIVSEHPRNKGVATAILQELVIIDTRLGLKPICSTEKSNVGAQTAIARCGFVA